MLETKIINMKRSEINLAEYNPRKISAKAKEELKRSIKRYGLVQPFIINSNSGNLVGGHQRLSIMDEINKYPSKDYETQVIIVELTEKEEVELNIVLNNKNSQGEYDNTMLLDIMDQFDIDLKSVGFDFSDIELMAGLEGLEVPEQFIPEAPKTENSKTKEEVKEMRHEQRKQARENDIYGLSPDPSNHDNKITFVFNNNKEKFDVMKALDLKLDEKFAKGYILENLLKNKE